MFALIFGDEWTRVQAPQQLFWQCCNLRVKLSHAYLLNVVTTVHLLKSILWLLMISSQPKLWNVSTSTLLHTYLESHWRKKVMLVWTWRTKASGWSILFPEHCVHAACVQNGVWLHFGGEILTSSPEPKNDHKRHVMYVKEEGEIIGYIPRIKCPLLYSGHFQPFMLLEWSVLHPWQIYEYY